jgi:phage tail-like protein
MPTSVDTGREDALAGFMFALDLGGKIEGYFTEVSGLGSENEVIESKVTGKGGKETVLKVPGRLKWGDIVCKRGITSNMDMWKWRKLVEDGKVGDARTNGSIVMYDQLGEEKARWNFFHGWPSKISGPTPKTDSNEIGIEELTIAHERIERAK